MNKTLAVMAVSGLVLGAGAAWAQTAASATVGTPDSNNILMIEQTEAVVAAPVPAAVPAQQPDGSWATGNGSAAAPMPSQPQNPQVTPPAPAAPGPAAPAPSVVEGSYNETVTPGSVTVDENAVAY